jgi:predicted nucleic acid-binding protein
VRLFLDSNVWISALATRGVCADLVREALRRAGLDIEILSSAQVRAEVSRVLANKFGVPRAELAAACEPLRYTHEIAPGPWQPPPGFPDPDDAPILAAALAAQADLFATGDCELLALDAVEGLAIVDPRTAYLRLRGLG